MEKTLAEFQAERLAANDRILSGDDRVIKRFFRLDGEAYEDGALPAKTKELLGLVASGVHYAPRPLGARVHDRGSACGARLRVLESRH